MIALDITLGTIVILLIILILVVIALRFIRGL